MSQGRRRWSPAKILAVVCGLALVGAIASAIASRETDPADRRGTAPAESAPPPSHGERPTNGGGGDQREGSVGHEGPYLPEARAKAKAAGDPESVARSFALAWINRPSDRRALARQNKRLVALSAGFWADQIAATLKGRGGGGSRGTVVGVEFIRDDPDAKEALVTTREQLTRGEKALEPHHYGLYLVRLERVGPGFAVSSWEPQF